jgi:F-type H+-transporting ATPase subunit b
MEFNWWTFGFQVVNVLVLLGLLSHFLFRPVSAMIARRAEETRQVLQEAEAAKRAASETRKAAEEERQHLQQQRPELLERARREADQQRSELVREAKNEATRIISEAEKKAERILSRAGQARAEETKQLALRIAGRLVENLPMGLPLAGYTERLVEAIGKLDAGKLDALLNGAGKLTLVAPTPPRDSDVKAVRKALAAVTGQDIVLEVETDRDIIAGLELKSRHGVIHNSLRSDLERVSAAVMRNDQQD